MEKPYNDNNYKQNKLDFIVKDDKLEFSFPEIDKKLSKTNKPDLMNAYLKEITIKTSPIFSLSMKMGSQIKDLLRNSHIRKINFEIGKMDKSTHTNQFLMYISNLIKENTRVTEISLVFEDFWDIPTKLKIKSFYYFLQSVKSRLISFDFRNISNYYEDIYQLFDDNTTLRNVIISSNNKYHIYIIKHLFTSKLYLDAFIIDEEISQGDLDYILQSNKIIEIKTLIFTINSKYNENENNVENIEYKITETMLMLLKYSYLFKVENIFYRDKVECKVIDCVLDFSNIINSTVKKVYFNESQEKLEKLIPNIKSEYSIDRIPFIYGSDNQLLSLITPKE